MRLCFQKKDKNFLLAIEWPTKVDYCSGGNEGNCESNGHVLLSLQIGIDVSGLPS